MNWDKLLTVAECGFWAMCVVTVVLLVLAFGIGAIGQAWTLVRERQRRHDNVVDLAAWVRRDSLDALHERNGGGR